MLQVIRLCVALGFFSPCWHKNTWNVFFCRSDEIYSMINEYRARITAEIVHNFTYRSADSDRLCVQPSDLLVYFEHRGELGQSHRAKWSRERVRAVRTRLCAVVRTRFRNTLTFNVVSDNPRSADVQLKTTQHCHKQFIRAALGIILIQTTISWKSVQM